jgi:hypothetical protein
MTFSTYLSNELSQSAGSFARAVSLNARSNSTGVQGDYSSEENDRDEKQNKGPKGEAGVC